MATDIRKNAIRLTPAERDKFLEAIFRLKAKPAPGLANTSVYDQFVALHLCVMTVRRQGIADPINYGHWNIGFCAWHREYLRRFELALQAEVPGVTLPYWDWADHAGARAKLFVNEFMGPLIAAPQPRPLTTGYLAFAAPNPKPAWWPANLPGWRVHAELQEIKYQPNATGRQVLEATLHRGSAGVTWPPSRQAMRDLETLNARIGNYHPFWFFWSQLEAGQPLNPNQPGVPTHNTGHNFIGGHMAQGLSPNDPIFFLHHANVDRIWATWQANRLAAVPNSTPVDHYPPNNALDPWTNDPAPPGHRLDDVMWPWIGAVPGYSTEAPEPIRRLVIDYRAEPARRVREVLDSANLGSLGGYKYA